MKVFRSRLSFIFSQKITQFVMLLLFVMVGVNFISNVYQFRGMDIIKMYHPMKLLLLSFNRSYYNADRTLLLIQLYPLIVACPAGIVLAKEKQWGCDRFIVSRVGKPKYIAMQILSAFVATTVVFTIPFIIEIILNCITFPINATGDILNFSRYDYEYSVHIQNYLFSYAYKVSPYFYAVLHTVCFGVFSGLLGAFTSAVSTIVHFKYRILCLLPPFVLLEGVELIRSAFSTNNYSGAWYNYLLLFSDLEKNVLGFSLATHLLVVVIIVLSIIGARRDCL